jgi:hypothetical protein
LALSDIYSDELRSQLARAGKQGMKHLLISAQQIVHDTPPAIGRALVKRQSKAGGVPA